MGLREHNARRNKELILNAAMALFHEHGYDDTTLEQVAERAEVSISTLYRYFPTKDLLVLSPIALNGQMADELARRPADEPLDLALGHAVLALLSAQPGSRQRLQQVRRIAQTSEILRTRLGEQFIRERIALQESVAERLGRDKDDIYCSMVARTAVAVLELTAARTAETDGNDTDDQPFLDVARQVMRTLHEEQPVFPRYIEPAPADQDLAAATPAD
ncbi:MAG TPA: helix-turn-helix domain-containing protein [Kineosporiaceae bacterium]|nr:helix-turn-helix domain-containing protein [Kineosporiaceae bacterium]